VTLVGHEPDVVAAKRSVVWEGLPRVAAELRPSATATRLPLAAGTGGAWLLAELRL
jgi:hypothetical protein